MAIARTVYRDSGKIFNPAVAAWTSKWKESRGDLSKPLPAHQLECPDFGEVLLNEQTMQLSFKNKAFALDLGGIAKGFILDELASQLKASGCRVFLLALGGEICAGQAPPGADSWPVKLEGPSRKVVASLKLCNEALSASGSSYQFLWRDGERISHLYHPLNKQSSIQSDIAYTRAKSSAIADAWATVLQIEGKAIFLKWPQELWGGLLNDEGWVMTSDVNKK